MTKQDLFVPFVLHLKSTKLVCVASCEYGTNFHQTWETLLAECPFYERFDSIYRDKTILGD